MAVLTNAPLTLSYVIPGSFFNLSLTATALASAVWGIFNVSLPTNFFGRTTSLPYLGPLLLSDIFLPMLTYFSGTSTDLTFPVKVPALCAYHLASAGLSKKNLSLSLGLYIPLLLSLIPVR